MTQKVAVDNRLDYEDKAGRMNAVTFDSADTRHAGLMQRTNFIANSRVVDMIGRMYADLFLQSRYLLNEVNIKIKLTRREMHSALCRRQHKLLMCKLSVS